MKRFLKTRKWFAAILSASLVFSAMQMPAFAAQKLYDQKTEEIVTKGVTYEFNHRLTEEGWQDIHVLKINLNDPNVVVEPIESQTELGLKETVLKMINDSGAVAGVNGDFFGMKGTHSASFGPVIKDGQIVSMGTDRNLDKNEYSTFFLDTEGNPFIDFFRVTGDFYANTYSHLELASINKATEMIYPICFTKQAGDTTAALDARFPELVKFVVENDVITKVSEKGETVSVPENGYVIILSGTHYDDVAEYFVAGQSAELRIQPSLDLGKIKTAISGVGRILVEGQVPGDPGLVIAGRQPRTALGISQDQNTLILMVVDGRTHSIGATQNEMAALMQEYGAYNAMHFDGGGSSTMVVNTIEDTQAEVKNTLSDGSQRKVMNSLGVFNNGPQGPVEHIILRPAAERVFAGSSVRIDATGYDAYYHKQDLSAEELAFTVTQGEGTFSGNVFTPSIGSTGIVKITAQKTAGNMESTNQNNPDVNGVGNNDSDTKSKDKDVNNSDTKSKDEDVNDSDTKSKDEDVNDDKENNGKNQNENTDKEAEQKNDAPNTPVENTPNTVGNQGNVSAEATIEVMELAVLTPSVTSIHLAQAGESVSLGFSGKSPDGFEGSVTGGVTYELSDASLGTMTGGTFTASQQGSGYLKCSVGNVSCYIPVVVGGAAEVEVPTTPQVSDPKQKSFASAEDGAYYIQIIGRVSSGAVSDTGLYESERAKAKTFVENGASLAVYGGKNDISSAPAVESLKWNGGYQFTSKPNTSIVQLTAANGGIRNTFAAQWISFVNDINVAGNDNVIFVMDKTPSAFSDSMETLLFRSVLEDMRKSGKNIFVVSASGAGYWSNLKDGIRYINLPDLWTADGKMNQDFRKLKIRVEGNQVIYDVEKMY